MYINMYAHIHIHLFIHIYVCIYIHIQATAHCDKRMRMHITARYDTRMWSHHVYMYTYIQIHFVTYIYMYTKCIQHSIIHSRKYINVYCPQAICACSQLSIYLPHHISLSMWNAVSICCISVHANIEATAGGNLSVTGGETRLSDSRWQRLHRQVCKQIYYLNAEWMLPKKLKVSVNVT